MLDVAPPFGAAAYTVRCRTEQSAARLAEMLLLAARSADDPRRLRENDRNLCAQVRAAALRWDAAKVSRATSLPLPRHCQATVTRHCRVVPRH